METTSEAFRQVFARFSRGFRFKNIFVKGSREQKKKSIFACRWGPRRTAGAAEPGPQRHAKIGKNHLAQSVRPSSLGGGPTLLWSAITNKNFRQCLKVLILGYAL